jgi:hypothetical protein
LGGILDRSVWTGKITEVMETKLMSRIKMGSASQPVTVFVEANFRAVGYVPSEQSNRFLQARHLLGGSLEENQF